MNGTLSGGRHLGRLALWCRRYGFGYHEANSRKAEELTSQ
jgi:hypothetical protein